MANSPYMKQIGGESLLDLQNQSVRAQKEQLKQIILKEIASATGMPHNLLTAQAQSAKAETAVQQSKTQLFDISKGDDDIQDFRSATGSVITEHEQKEVDKLAKVARLGAESLAGIHGSPVHVEAKHAQTAFSPHDKATGITPYRE